MPDFTNHFRMSEQDAIAYVLEKTDYFKGKTDLSCVEIGDGNINYVFRVEDKSTGRSIIIKQADSRIRSGRGSLGMERNQLEAEALQLEEKMAPGQVPRVYLYDPVMACTVMEDLRDYENMRYALIQRKIFPRFADQITTFMARTLMLTTDSALDPKEKKELVKRFINPGLCDITERLVYTDPYTNLGGGNVLFEPNREFLEQELYRDEQLLLEAAILKHEFESNAQCLLHGDLHTGSIFVTSESTKVLDPEFAFFGPAGYDVGNVVANLIFGWASARVSMEEGEEKQRFLSWVEESICGVVDEFARKSAEVLAENTRDAMYQSKAYQQWFIRGVLQDTAGVTGLELNRRIIGTAKVKDITGIGDPDARVLAERICVLAAKTLIKGRREAFTAGREYIGVLHDVCERAGQSMRQ